MNQHSQFCCEIEEFRNPVKGTPGDDDCIPWHQLRDQGLIACLQVFWNVDVEDLKISSLYHWEPDIDFNKELIF